MLALLVLAFGKPPVWSLFLTPFILSTVRSFFMPAKSAAIPALVPNEALMTANALSSITQSIVPMISLGLSAGVLGFFYSWSAEYFLVTAVMLNSISFFGSAAFIWRLPSLAPNRKGAKEVHPWIDFKEGIRYIRDRRVLVVLLIVQTGLSLATSPFLVVYIAANNKWFGGKPQTLAICELAFFAGMVGSSLYIGRLRIKRPGLWFICSAAIIGVILLLMASSQIFTLFVLWNLLAGLGVPFADIPVRTWMQSTVPDAFRGRINSVYTMIQAGVMPIGLSLGGLLVAHIGIEMAFVVMGAGMAFSALTGLLDRGFRRLEMTLTRVA